MAKKNEDPRSLLKLDAAEVATMNTLDLRGEIDRRVNRVFKLMNSESEIVQAAAREAMDEYIENQKQIFSSKGLDETRVYAEAIVASEENGATFWRIVPRKIPLEPVEIDDDTHRMSVASSRSYGARIGMGREGNRGKYNDGARLIVEAAASVEMGEVTPFTVL